MTPQDAAEVITYLENHGCKNISSHLDMASFGRFPAATSDFVEVYYGKRIDGSHIAIKTMDVKFSTNKALKAHKSHKSLMVLLHFVLRISCL